MSHFFGKLILFLLISCECVEGGRPQNKFVYEQEISEHCMRRVIPSVFLGRHVVDAYSQVLYFSKADLPYSCYVSVRAESGHNIILVAQLLSAEDLKAACEENANQLLVYELGETFGGYWGPMPQSFIQPESNLTDKPTRADTYTIKYTQPTTEPVSSPEPIIDRLTSSEQIKRNKTEIPYVEEENYITIMIPLVNISGRYAPGNEDKESAFEEDKFDVIYDVLPRLNEPYQTTMMPLLQFSVEQEPRWGYKDLISGYSFGQNWNTFTPDYRLKHQKYNESVKRRFIFKPSLRRRTSHKHSTLFSAIRDDSRNLKKIGAKKHSKYLPIGDVTTTSKHRTTTTTGRSVEDDIESWKSIEDLISAFNKSGSLTTLSDDELKQEVSELHNKLSGLDYNESAYLSFPRSTNILDFVTKTTLYPLTRRPIMTNRDKTRVDTQYYNQENNANSTIMSSLLKSTNMAKSLDDEVSFQETMHETIAHTTMSVTTKSYKNIISNKSYKDNDEQKSYFNITEDNISNVDTMATEKQSILEPTIHKLRTTPMTGSLLDHESWENLLRVAPAMAGRLDERMPQKILEELENTSYTKKNTSLDLEDPTNIETLLQTTNESKVTKTRDKRFIQGIMIEEARPHKLTTLEEVATTTSSSIHMSDIHYFAQLVELIDDDIHDRAALRYLSQYVGQPMFNLCSYEQAKPRYVQLFKSSRLVVAVGNFTLQSMQLVMTPAKLLLTGKSRCGQSYLECQVAGNRVCIDSMSACDGVANCGAPDIYDEDRLMCGAYVGLRHNVCLAAITFLAVLLTLIYMVHYWLGRCVPKVSEAFFIYTEGDENVLYLDTITRSPHDDDASAPVGKSIDAFETDAIFTMDSRKEPKMHTWLQKVLPCCFKKKDKKNSTDSGNLDQVHVSLSNTIFSFPQLEIRRLMNKDHNNTSVQTGESLEMSNLMWTKRSSREAGEGYTDLPDSQQLVNFTSHTSSDEQQRLQEELNLLKLLSKIRNDSFTTRTYDLVKNDESYTELSFNNEPFQDPEEMEIQSQFYDPRWVQDQSPSEAQTRGVYSTNYEVQLEKPKSSPSKRLRFSEDIVSIPNTGEYSDDEISTPKYDVRSKLETIDESAPSTSRDFKRFWVGSKGKKPKKKTQTLAR